MRDKLLSWRDILVIPGKLLRNSLHGDRTHMTAVETVKTVVKELKAGMMIHLYTNAGGSFENNAIFLFSIGPTASGDPGDLDLVVMEDGSLSKYILPETTPVEIAAAFLRE